MRRGIRLNVFRLSHVSFDLCCFIESTPGNHDRGETPVPIPNTEVKPSGADGTARGSEWESRALPGFSE